MASPAAARSVYVRGEVGIAIARGLPLFSAWTQGEAWADCAPLMLTSSQYVDCRGEEFERGTSRLAEVLRPLAEQAVPSHFAHPLLEPFPPSCVSVALPPTAAAHDPADRSAAILKVGAYASLEALLDALFANYLKEHFEPLTYGKSWMLVEAREGGFGFVVAPWSWLTGAADRPALGARAVACGLPFAPGYPMGGHDHTRRRVWTGAVRPSRRRRLTGNRQKRSGVAARWLPCISARFGSGRDRVLLHSRLPGTLTLLARR